MNRFPCLRLEGGILGAEVVDQIADGAVPGQKPEDFGFEARRHLTDEIAAAWSDARAYWQAFEHRLQRLSETESATSITRDQWVIPLLSLLGYELTYMSRAAEVEGKTYAISHRAGTTEAAPPIHIVSSRQSLDRRPESGHPRMAPHSLLQEYLNRTEHLWGLATNGLVLRLLRDSHRLRDLAYVEFDLQQMMEAEKFADFALLFRLLHRTRLPKTDEDAAECRLERYHRLTIEQGGRVRDKLRDGVEEALRLFANGFLHHPANQTLREHIAGGRLTAIGFYQQLLRLIYRLLFLMVAEERNLVCDNPIYREYYSVSRLRGLAEVRVARTPHGDLWLALQTTFRLLQDERLGDMLKIPPLNGDLFGPLAMPDLKGTSIRNDDFLSALWHLSMYQEHDAAPWRRINYAALDVEELGSIYESLLDYQPVVTGATTPQPTFELAVGTERKTTGSYYTPPELVQELIKSALEPVIQERLNTARTPEEKERAILSITVCDPASGSGHFLLAAARRLGRELARIRTGDEEPAPELVRPAIRDVITHCVYAVDKNPLAVDLCKVALWIEGHAAGKPLTFLDHRVRCGDSLVGVLDLTVLKGGIPDDAFDPVTGDQKPVARQLKRRNRDEREGRPSLPFDSGNEVQALAQAMRPLAELPQDTPEQIRRLAEAHQRARAQGEQWWRDNTACHLWTAAFFAELTGTKAIENRIPTTGDLQRYLEGQPLRGQLIGEVWGLAQRHHFFHWPLEFPEVFSKGGFDVVISNPPWERTAFEDIQFFSTRSPEIVSAPTTAARKAAIASLEERNPALFAEYKRARYDAEAENKWYGASGRFPLGASGRINTYALFAELGLQLTRSSGCCGVIVQTGIATDAPMEKFWRFLVKERRLVSLFDFENKKRLFADVHAEQKFALVTVTGQGRPVGAAINVGFWLHDPRDLSDTERVYPLNIEDLERLSPNTAQPVLTRRRNDLDIVRRIYASSGVCWSDRHASGPAKAWVAMTSAAFSKYCVREIDVPGGVLGEDRVIFAEGRKYLPLLEAKQIDQFLFAYASYDGVSEIDLAAGNPRELRHVDDDVIEIPKPRYWAEESVVRQFLSDRQVNRGWVVGYRDVTNVNNQRTAIAAVLPAVGMLQPLNGVTCPDAHTAAVVVGAINSLACDFVARLRFTGRHLNVTTFSQLPIPLKVDIGYVLPRVVELTYCGRPLKRFAEDCGYRGSEFPWNSGRRFTLRCELDAAFACFYGLSDGETAYVLDSFHVLRAKEESEYGSYRTKDTVLQLLGDLRSQLKPDWKT